MADDMGCADLGLSNEEAVSLLISSLNRVLEKQRILIVNTWATCKKQHGEHRCAHCAVSIAETGQTFDFKHEWHIFNSLLTYSIRFQPGEVPKVDWNWRTDSGG